jgi:hypothetical protein
VTVTKSPNRLKKSDTYIKINYPFTKKEGAIMMSKIGRAFRLWLMAIFKPGQVFDSFRSDPNKLEVGLWLLLFFSIFYSITALTLYSAKILPAIEPWLPVSAEKYYLYQAFWTVPWGLATAMMLAGIVHVMAVLLPATHAMNVFQGLARNQTTVIAPVWSILILLTGGLLSFGLANYLFCWDSQNKTRRGHPALALIALLPYILGTILL